MASTWISYNDLAWTEELLSDPAEQEKEVGVYIDLINSVCEAPPQNSTNRTLLHLGCGAGIHDKYFKHRFDVTGVDLSCGMLDLARKNNPEIEYIEGDMRSIRVGRQFDVVAIPDSIDYLVTREDLHRAIVTSAAHLKPGGILFIAGKTEETFYNNNFAYSGEKGDVHVTVLENNYKNPFSPHTYEITLVYLVRNRGKLSTYTEHTIAGLFPKTVWDKVLKDAGFTVKERMLEGLYDAYLIGEAEYPLTIFLGKKDV